MTPQEAISRLEGLCCWDAVGPDDLEALWLCVDLCRVALRVSETYDCEQRDALEELYQVTGVVQ